MTEARPRILATEPLAEEPAAWLAARADLRRCRDGAPEFHGLIAEADGLIVRTYTVVDERLLGKAPRLRVVGRAGVGVDNIDVPACRARGVEVVHTPEANGRAVIEYVLALLCDRYRPRPVVETVLTLGQWQQRRADAAAPRELGDLTLGILGLGRIGRALAALTAPLVRRVIYHDLVAIPAPERHGAVPVPLETLFDDADVLSLHVDGRASNRGFVDASLLARLRPDATLINTCRGFVVDNAALAAHLRAHPDAAAVLDVHEPEPFGADYPLLDVPNARLHPHLAGRTDAALTNMSWVVRDVLAVLEGQAPRYPAP